MKTNSRITRFRIRSKRKSSHKWSLIHSLTVRRGGVVLPKSPVTDRDHLLGFRLAQPHSTRELETESKSVENVVCERSLRLSLP